ncbi:hypothetical protein FNJ87_08885 [Nonlabens mediterrranea]|nr:hypothetical protein [Nonlabens mediterrranea]
MLGTFISLLFLAYVLWSITRKNALHWKKDNQVKLRINGKTLDIDIKFISQVWIEDQCLSIRRINRVDSFSITHLRDADVNKLVVILKEFEKQGT